MFQALDLDGTEMLPAGALDAQAHDVLDSLDFDVEDTIVVSTAQWLPTQPHAVGWRSAAQAIRAAMRLEAPVLLTVVPSGAAPIWVDFGTARYTSDLPLSAMPYEVGEVAVHSRPVAAGEEPFPWAAWRRLDELLWWLGGQTSGDERHDGRHRLTRWPDLAAIPGTRDADIRMIASLANDALTVEELALVSSVDVEEARRMLDRLGLLDAVRPVSDDSEQPTIVADIQAIRTERAQHVKLFEFFDLLRRGLV